MSKTRFTGEGAFRRDAKLCRMCIEHDGCHREIGECVLCDLPAECCTPEFEKIVRALHMPLWLRAWLELRYPKTGWLLWFYRYRIVPLFGRRKPSE